MRYLLNLVLTLTIIKNILSTHERGAQIAIVEDGEKWEQYGSIVIYTGKEILFEKVENLLVRAHNHVNKYNIKLKKVNCDLKKDRNTKCRLLKNEPLVYVYMNGVEKRLTKSELNGTDRAINEILFIIASTNYEKLIYCPSMDKAYEIVDMSRKVFNVIVGAFQNLNGEDLRHFLEAAMELGKEYTFVIVDIESINRKMLNKHGYFVEFYYALTAELNENVESANISHFVNTNTKNLIDAIKTLEMTKDLQKTIGEFASKKKIQDDKYEELKRIELIKIEKLKRGESISNVISSKGMVSEKPKPVKYPSVPESRERVTKKHENNEIAQATYMLREKKILNTYKNHQVTEQQLKKYLGGVQNYPGSLLLVLFYVPWDPIYESFEENFVILANEYKNQNRINLVQLDCTSWPTSCLEYQINSYPRILAFKNGIETPILYKGMLHKEELKNHIMLWNEDFLPVITETRQLEELSREISVMFIMGVFNEKTDPLVMSAFKKTAIEYFGKVRIGIFKLKEKSTLTFQQMQINVPSIISINANEARNRIEKLTEFTNEKIASWIEAQRQQDVEELTYLSLPRILALKKPIFISFRPADRDRSLLAKLAKQNRNITTVWMNIDLDITRKIHQSYNLQQKEALILLRKESNQIFEFMDVKKTISNINNWIHQCLNFPEENIISYTLPTMSWKGFEGIDFLHLINRNEWVNDGADINSDDIIDDEDNSISNVENPSLNNIKVAKEPSVKSSEITNRVGSSSQNKAFYRMPKVNIEEEINEEVDINDAFRYYDEL
ncbi:thioredoxin domain-containing protein 16 isoform X5 [Hydra vulgaris]|uniref:Thioredoxin domain-containing protein 16 isoform X5 n=2 Tax=Hydra vulgaris TaxID=6087 RepID=A0ABM4B5M8_HYDVU